MEICEKLNFFFNVRTTEASTILLLEHFFHFSTFPHTVNSFPLLLHTLFFVVLPRFGCFVAAHTRNGHDECCATNVDIEKCDRRAAATVAAAAAAVAVYFRRLLTDRQISRLSWLVMRASNLAGWHTGLYKTTTHRHAHTQSDACTNTCSRRSCVWRRSEINKKRKRQKYENRIANAIRNSV